MYAFYLNWTACAGGVLIERSVVTVHKGKRNALHNTGSVLFPANTLWKAYFSLSGGEVPLLVGPSHCITVKCKPQLSSAALKTCHGGYLLHWDVNKHNVNTWDYCKTAGTRSRILWTDLCTAHSGCRYSCFPIGATTRQWHVLNISVGKIKSTTKNDCAE